VDFVIKVNLGMRIGQENMNVNDKKSHEDKTDEDFERPEWSWIKREN